MSGSFDPGLAERHLDEWRDAASRVSAAWEVWRAADRGDRALAYDVYVGALAAEERAAEAVERDARLATS